MSVPTPLQEVLNCHHTVFHDELAELKGTQASIVINSDVQPRFYKSWSLLFALKTKVETELDWLQTEGAIDWLKVSVRTQSL